MSLLPKSLLYAVVFASRCRSNHHRLAVDALRHLKSPDAELWRNLLLHYHGDYLSGAKAPDNEFKDFKNHVLHVREGEWGGAVEACEEWQRRTASALKSKDWRQAAWSAGVMSHYYVDPIQPFHTHQSEEENVIHRAVEQSFSKSYGALQRLLERDLGGYPEIEAPRGADWVARMVRAGAAASNPHYEALIDHYDFEAGAKDPPAGLDYELKTIIARLIGHAAVGLACMLDRTFEEAAVKPPDVGGNLQAFFLALEMPIQAVLKSIEDGAARREVEAQYEEFRRTGKVRASLGEDDRIVRALHAAEVLKTPLSSLDAKWPREIGAKSGAGMMPRVAKAAKPRAEKIKPEAKRKREAAKAEPRKAQTREKPAHAIEVEKVEARALEQTRQEKPKPERAPASRHAHRLADLPPGARPPRGEHAPLPPVSLDGGAPVVKAPSIGPKTARRLEELGVRTVADLLSLSPERGERILDVRHISAQVIKDWQAQALLACTVPGLRSREAQALVACGVANAADLAQADAETLTELVAHWGLSEEGARAWGAAPAPSEHDIADWIALAGRAQPAPARTKAVA